MKREKIAAIILLGLVLFICVYMLFHWKSIKETTILRGAVGLEKGK